MTLFRCTTILFLILGAVGTVLSVIAHLLAGSGQPLSGGSSLWVALHAGVFVVWPPTVFIANAVTHGARKHFWKLAFSGCPRWMKIVLLILAVYTVVNFILFLAATTGFDRPENKYNSEFVRGFSGHWLVFYFAAFATCYSALVIGYSGTEEGNQ